MAHTTETAAVRRARKLFNATRSMETAALNDGDDIAAAIWGRARKAAARKLYAEKTSQPITVLNPIAA